jgi:DNA-binding SARP family transcriptional activator
VTNDRGVPVTNTASPRLFLWCPLFGRFEVFHDNELLALPNRPKILAILRYLLASPNRSVSRDFLMDWLWCESDFAKAKYSVN